MRYSEYSESGREGKEILYAAEGEGFADWPDTLARRRLRGRDHFYAMRGNHFHRFGSARSREGEVSLRREIEGCSDCPFDLVVAYAKGGGEPIRLTLMWNAEDYVAAEEWKANARAEALAEMFGRRRASACA